MTARPSGESARPPEGDAFRRLVDASPHGLAVLRDGVVRYANPALARMFGYGAPADLAGRELAVLTVPGESTRIAQATLTEPPARAVVSLEFEGRRRDGTSLWVEGTLAAAWWEGAPAHALTLVDITAQKRLQEQYLHAQKMEAVGQLAGGIAHDFNNLLTVILGRSELVLEQLQDADPLTRDLELVRRTAERATSLTRQLLAFSRRQVLELEVVDVNGVLEGLGPMLRRLIGEDVTVTLVAGGQGARVRADYGQLEQVMMNLAVNARDAMPRGGRLTIETAQVELDETFARQHEGARTGPHVMIAVSDTGVGMDSETRARIFEPFFTTKERGKGTGLGLSTVYGIVKQFGGTVAVYSHPGQGSVFRLYLPHVQGPPGLPVGRRAGSAISPGGTETVLLVEDDPDVRSLARESLRRYGYTVLEARDSMEALRMAEAATVPVDLLMTDVVLPEMGGAELARRLGARWPGLRVLFVSGYAPDAVVRHGILPPGIPFLAKPFTLASLARRVREALDVARLG